MINKVYPFIVINKNNMTEIRHFSTAENVAVHLLGRKLNPLFVIVNETKIVHLSTIQSSDIRTIQDVLEEIQAVLEEAAK
jgi:hypothetical protein